MTTAIPPVCPNCRNFGDGEPVRVWSYIFIRASLAAINSKNIRGDSPGVGPPAPLGRRCEQCLSWCGSRRYLAALGVEYRWLPRLHRRREPRAVAAGSGRRQRCSQSWSLCAARVGRGCALSFVCARISLASCHFRRGPRVRRCRDVLGRGRGLASVNSVVESHSHPGKYWEPASRCLHRAISRCLLLAVFLSWGRGQESC